MSFWLLLSLAVGFDQSAGLISVRSDDGRRAVFDQAYGGTPTMPKVGGAIYVAQGAGGPRQFHYDVWLVTFDCETRERTNTAKITYSSWRDPQNVIITPHRVEGPANPAVADQLALVCDGDRQGRDWFQTLDRFFDNRPQR